jgi:hypothetical protein
LRVSDQLQKHDEEQTSHPTRIWLY